MRQMMEQGSQFKSTYPIEEPYVYVAILEDPVTKEITYKVIEPTLTPDDKSLLEKIKKRFLDELDIDVSELSKENIYDIIEERVRKIVKNYIMKVDEGMLKKFLYYIKRDFLGFEKIDPLMKDHFIEDISCDGVGLPIYVWHREYESIKTNLAYDKEEELNRFVVRLAYLCGKHISVADPILDGSLPDGSRVNATYGSEISRKGTTFTIRRFRADPLTITDLIQLGTISVDLAAYLWYIIENKSSILIAGEIASGKTTLLNCTSMFIRPDMKIVSIEETPELNLPHTNWIPMATRTGFGRKSSDVTLFELLKNALRQRPDYIIVGEVRGEEAYTLFQALATGHGVQATIHADTPEKVVSRLESEPMNVPRPLIGLLDIIMVQGRVSLKDKPARRTLNITEIKEYNKEKNEVVLNEVARWDPARDQQIKTGESIVLKRIAERKGLSLEGVISEINKRKVVLNWMVRKGMRRYAEIGTLLREYYADSEKVFKRALVESL
ncbi:MAG: type II/IV secretion system ATPase subunit [Candidatus Methanomethyliaceae archaeon]|nr:type II/IV secretion system ATPase subunit [Candidatus Methanomethyliaceae archaeon]